MVNRGGKRPGAGRPKGVGPYGEKTCPIRIPLSLLEEVRRFVGNRGYQLPLYLSKVRAGTPTPADDYIEKHIDLAEYLIRNPATTFLVRASGNSMINANIQDGDLLVADRSIEPTNGKIVIAAINGELTVKRLKKTKDNKIMLVAENPEYPPIEIKPEQEMVICGIVTQVIHALT